MKIVLNGEPCEVAGPLTLTALLAHLNVDARRVAVEHNMDVVKRAKFNGTEIHEGDQIEIVNFEEEAARPPGYRGSHVSITSDCRNGQVSIVPGRGAATKPRAPTW